MTEILIIATCAWLWRLGGAGHKWARRIIIPLILALSCAFLTKTWWIFLAVGVGLQTIGLGYGVPDEGDKGSWLGRIFKIFWLTRGIYGAIVACGASLGLIIGGFIPWWAFVGYVVLNFVVGSVLSALKVKDIIIEPCIGAVISLVILL